MVSMVKNVLIEQMHWKWVKIVFKGYKISEGIFSLLPSSKKLDQNFLYVKNFRVYSDLVCSFEDGANLKTPSEIFPPLTRNVDCRYVKFMYHITSALHFTVQQCNVPRKQRWFSCKSPPLPYRFQFDPASSHRLKSEF